ncbi:hypothetical protein L1049_020898 [Liquidambar formosana]|uniref:Plastid division protein PDV1 n=1 Tax=Liquidambar formosana TaxID=63359 RepID=A0AAP0S9U4_LIQFO
MKWEMEVEEIEAVLEKIWDLHDKLSDAIHSISRTHFLNSVKTLRKPEKKKPYNDDVVDENRTGFVFVKDFRVDVDDSAVQEAKSLNAIRTALENLEDQLEFFHTVQIQQRAERDAAIARLEQSRIVLAMRNFVPHEGKRSNILIKVLHSSFSFAKNSLKLDHMGGILGNAALVAVSMLAMLHLNQITSKDKFVFEPAQNREGNMYGNRNTKGPSMLQGSSSYQLSHLDVFLARG